MLIKSVIMKDDDDPDDDNEQGGGRLRSGEYRQRRRECGGAAQKLLKNFTKIEKNHHYHRTFWFISSPLMKNCENGMKYSKSIR